MRYDAIVVFIGYLFHVPADSQESDRQLRHRALSYAQKRDK